MSDITEIYREKLLAERSLLLSEAEKTSGDRRAVTLDQQSVGRLSRMDAMQQQSMAQAQERRRQSRLRAIEAALGRLDEDEFGFCVDCGDDISAARLAHDPTVLRCIECAKG